ncbi:undecaprenyl-phosphate galactose phosphotransferase [Endobacter medicaginis]|uniref:Exopolysaccharide biosynthesis polyprenyl glycosylphosphotransferase n=1 Tax=Endobacter medicaginis TaxID=1181271 RepID=A0A839V524_9PROT|nr:exopolysaccharide biosynthesis polyprenyl glycosylphosphotransferase [Endobacter medicaginis]MBB3174642.1 undecaprenyl-phosphate galactose phosphotransferase [Endobacter medicaginis]MCX5474666.1 exopolysaccharide biosynthesis polyprenyl glycosylphosphotransferase [Endobacter medicaginis]NVN30138.1 exopolysaccharide biosynthesis polyprenyl glycosylphosphotransferase [Endobacter medicaginis]
MRITGADFLHSGKAGAGSWSRPAQPSRTHLGGMALSGTVLAGAGLAVADLGALVAGLAIARGVTEVLHHVLGTDRGDDQQMAMAILYQMMILAGVMVYLGSCGHYRDRPPFWSALQQVVRAATCALLVAALVGFSTRTTNMHLFLLLPWLLFPLTSTVLRAGVKHVAHRLGIWQIPVLMIAEPTVADHLLEVFSGEGTAGFRVVGRISPDVWLEQSQGRAGRDVLRSYGVQRVVIGVAFGAPASRDLLRCVTRTGVPFTVIPQDSDLPVLGCSQMAFFSHDTLVLNYRNNLERPLLRGIKIALDLGLASAMMLVLLPVFAVLALLVRLDGGPAMFGHERIGLNGRTFRCLKFRSMVPNAAEVLRELLERDPQAAEEWKRTQKLGRDPRVTRVGQFLRKTSLDELPQLINVLRLEMSLVGPRPIVPAEEIHYGDEIAYYRSARPGITGLWQVSGRSDTSYPRRVQLDSWYVRNWSVWHDVAILMKTLPAVLLQRGAR